MKKSFCLRLERNFSLNDFPDEFFSRLDGTLRPTVLLGFERVDFDGQLRRRDDVRQENELPALHLGAVGKVEVFRQSVVLPAARVLNAALAPNSSGSVKIKKPAGTISGGVFDHEMAV